MDHLKILGMLPVHSNQQIPQILLLNQGNQLLLVETVLLGLVVQLNQHDSISKTSKVESKFANISMIQSQVGSSSTNNAFYSVKNSTVNLSNWFFQSD